MIFSTKALILTVAMALLGLIVYGIFKMIGLKVIGIIFLVIFALIGFVVGTCKMPQMDSIKISRETAGENLDDIIKRAIKFKLKKNRIYVYAKEEKDNGTK
ncbi:MAG: hypothetical protein ACI4UX_03075 [Clostridia bacterium]